MLADGVSEMELDDVEQQLGVKLPLDLRCAYRLHNGQKIVSNLPQSLFTYGYLSCSSVMIVEIYAHV